MTQFVTPNSAEGNKKLKNVLIIISSSSQISLYEISLYINRLKSSESQHKNNITQNRQNHSGITIIYALKDTCKNSNYF